MTFLGIALIVLGTLSLMVPLLTGVLVTTMVGVLVLAGGIVEVLSAFRASGMGQVALRVVLGALMALCGAFMLGHPLFGLAAISFYLAAYFVAEGITGLVLAFRIRPHPACGWTLFHGAVSLLLGFMLFRQWPLSGGWAVGVLFGIHLVMAGATLLSAGRSDEATPAAA